MACSGAENKKVSCKNGLWPSVLQADCGVIAPYSNIPVKFQLVELEREHGYHHEGGTEHRYDQQRPEKLQRRQRLRRCLHQQGRFCFRGF